VKYAPRWSRQVFLKKKDKPAGGQTSPGAAGGTREPEVDLGKGAKGGDAGGNANQHPAPTPAHDEKQGRGLEVFPGTKSSVEGQVVEEGRELVMEFKARTVAVRSKAR